MKIAYLDCAAGIRDNMLLGALLDYGLPQDYLLTELGKLTLELSEIRIEHVKRQGIAATLLEVSPCQEPRQCYLDDIALLIHSASLKSIIKEKALRCFQDLATAEAKVHGIGIEEINFNETGAINVLINIVGTVIGLEYFNFDVILTSPIRMGYGSIKGDHGEISLPDPTTLELIKGFTIFSGQLSGEWTAPAGAAILKTFTQQASAIPTILLEGVGYGAGTVQKSIPNVLRLIVGEDQNKSGQTDEKLVLETNIDDMNPEILGYLGDQLLKCGVNDYFYTPIYMKKNRPATKLTIIMEPQLAVQVEKLLFMETTTLGVRKYLVQRSCMDRGEVLVEVDQKLVRVKTGLLNGKIVKFAPEYEDCLALAKQTGKPLRLIYEETVYQAKQIMDRED